MDTRCIKFWEDGQALVQAAGANAQRLPQTIGKMLKELKTMSRFLQRNQSQRFNDSAQQKGVEAIALYVSFSKQHAPAKTNDEQKLIEETFKVLKDALAMPFTVFGTKQKKRLFKWYNELLALGGGEPDDTLPMEGLEDEGATVTMPRIEWSVLDMDGDGFLSLLNNETGDTNESFRLVKKSAEYKQIKNALEKAEITVITMGDEVVQVKVVEE